MRIKTTLAAAAILAAGLASSMAQNVYSLNVVGYVNVDLKTGFNFVANPLNATPDNKLDTIMASPAVTGTIYFKWVPSIFDFDANTAERFASGWVNSIPGPAPVLNVGEAAFFLAPAPYTQTFVGEVKQGSTSIKIEPVFNTIASPAPIGGTAPTVLAQYTPNVGDQVSKWDNSTVQDFTSPDEYFATGWVPSTPPLKVFGVGEGIFYYNSTAVTNTWVRTFTVQ